LLQIIDTSSVHTQALVVAPTRELASQTAFVIQSIGEFMGVKVHTCVGGTVVREDI
jgi:superfamily II DNA/RNA helicase